MLSAEDPHPPENEPHERRQRICFLFNAQRHQLLHGISTAVEMARNPATEVHVVAPSDDHIEYARRLADRLGGAPIRFRAVDSRLLDAARRRTGRAVPPKLLTLIVLAPWLNGFDAIALPERTSTILKTMGVRHPSFIHLDHGAGDRAAGFDARIRRFDFVLMAGEKHRERLLRGGLVRPDDYAVVGYPKFDAADAVRDATWKPFPADSRLVVLYNPHFSPLGSWTIFGADVLEAFAAQSRYNLVVAPHVRLLDGATAQARWRPFLDRFADHPHILIDRGSDRCIDMSYTMAADVYLGDVSSQVYEFLRMPRPCLFLNAHGIDWQNDENYAHWHFGPVVRAAHDIVTEVDRAVSRHPEFSAAQREGSVHTFGASSESGSERAAAAIADHLADRAVRKGEMSKAAAERQAAFGVVPRGAVDPRAIASGQSGRRRRVAAHLQASARRASLAVRKARAGMPRAAMLALAAFGGWLLHDIGQPSPSQAATVEFVNEAVTSHRVTLLREAMHSQQDAGILDPEEIRVATGLVLPKLPADWKVRDVQVFPSDAGPSVQLFLTGPHGERFSLVGMQLDTPADGRTLLIKRKGDDVAFWEVGEQTFGLVGSISTKRLLRLASSLTNDKYYRS